jgi:hypothetical protein
MPRQLVTAILAASLALGVSAAQRRDAFVAPRDHAAIRYSSGPTSDAVEQLNRALRAGQRTLQFEERTGYLRSVLRALQIPVESQMLVFSPTSLQADRISYHNPRAVYFGDTVSVGWVRGGDLLEVAALDPAQGVVFYSLDQAPSGPPQFRRTDSCLACHLSWDTAGVPGLLLTSMFPLPDDPNAYANGFTTTQSSPYEQRWGGWWVTGEHGGARHMGNVPVMPPDKKLAIATPTRVLSSVEGLFDLADYPSPYSDIVAQLVLAHQTRVTNMMVRLGWEARLAAAQPSADASERMREAAADLVDYLLFVDEEPLPGPVRGTSGFAEVFAKAGPRDSRGRSLRDFELERRLFRHPLSYMIYTDTFDSLPADARETVYARMLHVLTGRDPHPKYRVLTAADRRAIAQILRETKMGLPAGFAAL